MQDFVEALDQGDYGRACDVLARTDFGRTPVGAASCAFLRALEERFDEAERMLVGAGAPAIDAIVRGERQRVARLRDPRAAEGLNVTTVLPFVGAYAGMASALLRRDAALADRIKGDLDQVPAVAGRVTFKDGQTRDFGNIVDSDDSIGQMLEVYVDSGLLFMPLATLRRIEFLPAKNFIDRIVPKVQITERSGLTAFGFVPLLYAGSASSADQTIRAGRMTSWDYVGTARRGFGQRDFILDRGVMIGMERVVSIDLVIPASA